MQFIRDPWMQLHCGPSVSAPLHHRPIKLEGMATNSASSAFSLLELLITVTIVALLAALMLPVLALVREGSRSAVCLNNLRQIGLGDMAYAADHRGMMTPSKIEFETYDAGQSPDWAGSWNTSWMEQLFPYMAKNSNRADSKEVYTCPQAKLERKAVQWPSTYGANGSVHPFCSDYRGNKPGRPDHTQWSYIRAMQIPRPSEVIGFMDASVNSVGTSTETLLYSNYQTVHELRKIEIWRAESPVDGPYGVGTWYNNNNTDRNAYFPRWRHQRNTRGGAVFVDGHAAVLGRQQTLMRNFSTDY